MEKEKVIQQLAGKRLNDASNKGTAPVCNHRKLKLGEYEYMKDKVEDLEKKLRLILSELTSSDESLSSKIGRIED